MANNATKDFLSEQKRLLNLIDSNKVSLKDAQLAIEHFWAGSLKNAVLNGDIQNGSLMAGQSVSLVKKVQTVEEIFEELLLQIKGQINQEEMRSNG